MSLLFFGDVHYGLKSYSTIDSDGKYTAELDCINALEAIYERCKQLDIEIIIMGGDFFHTSHPSTSNIKWVISWLNKLEQLNKQIFFILGNHDCSSYSSSLIFMNELGYKNIHLIEKHDKNFIVPFGKFKIKFVPYELNLVSSKEKDKILYSNINECVQEAEDGDIIVSHLQESSCRIGSEKIMISKSVSSIDASTNKNIIMLLSHIHLQQKYMKGSTTVCYSGSINCSDVSDTGLDKGYIIVNENGEIIFEPILNIRKFIKHVLTKDEDVIEYFQNKRLPVSSVNFLEHVEDFDITKLTEIFKSKEVMLGWAHKIKENKSIDSIEISTESKDNYSMFNEYINKKYELNKELKYKDDIINEGTKFINNHIGQNYE